MSVAYSFNIFLLMILSMIPLIITNNEVLNKYYALLSTKYNVIKPEGENSDFDEFIKKINTV
jgi:hypothetical protein